MTPYRQEISGSRQETIAWCAVAALALFTVLRLGSAKLAGFDWTGREAALLQLSATEDSEGVCLRWTPPANSSGGILFTVDDSGRRSIPLSVSLVNGGQILHGAVHGRAQFELAIQIGSSGWRWERIEYLHPAADGDRRESADRVSPRGRRAR